MPNTLAHIGLQVPLTRMGLKKAPLQWIMVGCIIPDIPWIVQRILTPLADPLTLRLYTATQASLIYCLLLCLAFSMLSRNSRYIFLILAGNSLAHLIIDATQIKWGNSVNLLVPFSWDDTSFNLFWPEHISSYTCTTIGLLVCFLLWPKAIRSDLLLEKPDKWKTTCAAICFLFYLASPSLLISSAYNADIHFSKTLANIQERTGKMLEIDRASFNMETNTLQCYVDKNLKFPTALAIQSATVSIRGQFISNDTIELKDFHIHRFFRDFASYVGLLLATLLWVHSLIHRKQHPHRGIK